MSRLTRGSRSLMVAAAMAAAWVGAVLARSGTEGVAPAAVYAAPAPQLVSNSRVPGLQQGAGGPQGPAAAEYVGEETCLTCHEDQARGYAGRMHGRRDHPRAPGALQGCETCHGAGSAHVDDPEAPGLIRALLKEPPEVSSATCATCHARGTHALWEGSTHEARNVACVDCHRVHTFRSEHALLRTAREMDTCATCHRDKVAKLDRSGHMPLREGKMDCSTCHNVHGSTNVRLLSRGDSIAEACTSCHADKRGPFLWEHAPSRDGCTTCHDPHGSPNDRMLVTRTPILCQRCHIARQHPSTIYDGALIGAGASPSVRIYARSCITCHSNIHGSNHPSGQRFIR